MEKEEKVVDTAKIDADVIETMIRNSVLDTIKS